MKRTFVPVLVVASLATVAGCGGSRQIVTGNGPRLAHIVPPSPTSLRFSTASNRQAAFENVRKLIRIVVVPRGAHPVAEMPQGAPVWLAEQMPRGKGLAGVASTHRIWIVQEPLKQVVLFVQSHARPQPRPEARYRTAINRIGSRPVRSYAFPPIPGRSWSRWLNVDMAALPNGWTVVLAQAGDYWIHTPPRSAEIRGRVRRIDIVSRLGKQRPNVLVHVRNPYDVGWIVALTNGLGVVPHNVGCLLDARFGGRAVTLRFRAADGHVLARATVPDFGGLGTSGPCNPLELTVSSRPAVPLIGADLLLRIQRFLNVELAPPLRRDVASCLMRQHGWKVSKGGRELTATKNGKRWTFTFHLTGKVTADKPAPRQLRRCLRAAPRYVIYGQLSPQKPSSISVSPPSPKPIARNSIPSGPAAKPRATDAATRTTSHCRSSRTSSSSFTRPEPETTT